MVRIGSVFPGPCNGYFGRNSAGPKRVEALGADWIVVRLEMDGQPLFASFSGGPKHMDDCMAGWEWDTDPPQD